MSILRYIAVRLIFDFAHILERGSSKLLELAKRVGDIDENAL